MIQNLYKYCDTQESLGYVVVTYNPSHILKQGFMFCFCFISSDGQQGALSSQSHRVWMVEPSPWLVLQQSEQFTKKVTMATLELHWPKLLTFEAWLQRQANKILAHIQRGESWKCLVNTTNNRQSCAFR